MSSSIQKVLFFILGAIFGVSVFVRCMIEYHSDIDIDCAAKYIKSNTDYYDLVKVNCSK